MEEIGADPDQVHARYLIDDGGPRGRQWAEQAVARGWLVCDPEVMTGDLRELCEELDGMNRDELAEAVRDETMVPYCRQVAYAFYLDHCTAAEIDAETKWQEQTVALDDYRGMAESMN